MKNKISTSPLQSDTNGLIAWAICQLLLILTVIFLRSHSMFWLMVSFFFILVFLLRYTFKDRLLDYVWKNKKLLNSIRLGMILVCLVTYPYLKGLFNGYMYFKYLFFLELFFILWLHELIQARVEIYRELRKQ